MNLIPLVAPAAKPRLSLPPLLLWSQGDLVEGFEDVSEWTLSDPAAGADNPALAHEGTQSITLTSTDAVAATAMKVINWPLTEVGSVLSLAAYLDGAYANVQDVTIYLETEAPWVSYFYWQLHNDLAAGCDNGVINGAWRNRVLPVANWATFGTPAWTDTCTKIQIRCTAVAGQTISVSFDNLRQAVSNIPAVCLTFDDGRPGQLPAARTMRALGLRGTSYVPTASIGTDGYLTWAQCREMEALGVEIGNHSSSHTNFTTLTQGEIETELTTAQAALEAQGLTRASRHVAYPFGGYDADAEAAMVATGMLSGRRVLTHIDAAFPDMLLRQIPCKTLLRDSDTLASAQADVLAAEAAGMIYFAYTHNVTDTPTANDWSTANYTALMEFIVRRGLPSLRMTDIYRLLTEWVAI